MGSESKNSNTHICHHLYARLWNHGRRIGC